jgi:predicted esterase
MVALIGSAADAPADLGPGLHAKLPCGKGTPYTYTAYLPPAYATTSDPLPVLFLSSPSANPPVANWQAWADAHEVVVIGINDSRNGQEEKELRRIQDAVLTATAARLRLHPYLRFSSGPSGGAMVSAFLAQRNADHWGGVLMLIHGGNGIRPDPEVPIAFLVGEQDQVYPFSAVQRDYMALREAGNTLRIESYPGLGHGGVPQADAERMMEWLLDHARLTHRRLPESARRKARETIKARLLAAPTIAEPVVQQEKVERLVLLPKLTSFRESEVRPVLDAWHTERLARIDAMADLRTRHFYLRELLDHPAAGLLTAKQRRAVQTRLDQCRTQSPVKEEWEAEQAFAQLPDIQHVTLEQTWRVIREYEAFANKYPDTYEGKRAAKIAEAFRAARRKAGGR